MRIKLLGLVEKIETLALMFLMVGVSIISVFLILAGLLHFFGGNEAASLLLNLTLQGVIATVVIGAIHFLSTRYVDRQYYF